MITDLSGIEERIRLKLSRFKTVIFDLDGTLLDTLEDLTDAVNYALEAYKMPQRTIEEIRSFVGNGVRNLMLQAVPNRYGSLPGYQEPDSSSPYPAYWLPQQRDSRCR